jgi:hypothetical protein
MTKFTPGPWQWCQSQELGWHIPGVLAADYNLFFNGSPDGDGHDKANARLIAQAPTMHAELTALLQEHGHQMSGPRRAAVEAVLAMVEGEG